MLSNHQEYSAARQARIEKLETYYQRSSGWLLSVLFIAFIGFIVWTVVFKIDEVARATGEVIASSRVQVIQAVDGGVLSRLEVKVGDKVELGQVLARLDQTRVDATSGEVEARLYALKAKAMRLRAEVTRAGSMSIPENLHPTFEEQISVEQELFEQRRKGLNEELYALQVAVDLANRNLRLMQGLLKSNDVSSSELIKAQQVSNDTKSKYINRQNRFLEEAQVELSKTEDDIAQNEQVLNRRNKERVDSVFTAQVNGIVKSIKMTTVGGVLRAGEEIMQIVPVDDDLIIEAKVSPADIARIQKGLETNIRFDPFDYTIFGSVEGKVIYVSADTLKEDTARGQEIFYRVHVSPSHYPVVTSNGRTLEILPGMTAQVDIKTGNRTVMDYLLKPLKKTLSESFGER